MEGMFVEQSTDDLQDHAPPNILIQPCTLSPTCLQCYNSESGKADVHCVAGPYFYRLWGYITSVVHHAACSWLWLLCLGTRLLLSSSLSRVPWTQDEVVEGVDTT